ncbi:MAG: alanine racemase, partial [Candidatus Krumholzibacteria bacterium]|nr:alanine racemase [Candidatus Krumholzibacteria bacterium]
EKIIGPDLKICAVMKADAYGHGIRNLVAQTVAIEPAYIAAICNSEFRTIYEEIRKQNKDISLLRIAPVLRDELIESIINKWNVEEIIGSLGEVRMISATAEELSRSLGRDITVNVHVNIETGIGRMAFRDTDKIKKALQLPHLKLKGVMTHFANAYEKEPIASEKTRQQTEKFDKTVAELGFDKSIIRHIANSGATAKFPWTRKNMVRVGTLTYGEEVEGLDPAHKLRPVMVAYKSRVGIIEDNVPPMSPIGYDSMERTSGKHMSTTATVRAGYSEGFPEMAFKENMKVLIRDRRFPVIGKTSMNLLVVDITDQDKNNPVQLNDEVVLIGKQGDQEISLEEFAAKSKNTITPLIISLGNAVDRIIVPGRGN